MPADPWVYVLDEVDLVESTPRVVYPRGVPVLLIRKEGHVYALSNKCSHMGCPLDGGTLTGHILQCPCHYWRYDVRTGTFLDAAEISLRLYQWRIIDGRVFIRIEV
jgi:3-phenylpropionate/trans-cinnamate dioxygenase ferredoxin subunit